jgi:radical SAM/Cys-rich protein
MTDARELPLDASGPDPELSHPGAGPRRTTSLHARHSLLASPDAQIEVLDDVDLSAQPFGGEFSTALRTSGCDELRADAIEVFQINLGKLCNMTCRHCHVDAGPDRWAEVMDRETVNACLAALDRTAASTVDLTGGAPELNPHFRDLVDACVQRGLHVLDRCNLTVLLLPRCRDLPAWLAERGVEVVCSLPHFRQRNTDAQRGDGTFSRSIEALRRLNAAGYGQGRPDRRLTLVVNPVGAFLAGDQATLEREWRDGLVRSHEVTFDRLIALNNMPIARYLEWLEESDNLESYMGRLLRAFNPGTVRGLMCRNTLSVSWDGRIFDCDFNQMLDLPSRPRDGAKAHVRDLDRARFEGRSVVIGRHCFGCTAGCGSSCSGALNREDE